ncbi:DUF4143 domain-containing protein [Trueperella pyogenes]|uniref:DUF4143 domain-containing protein n=1 Tax=Trueperella pyogenes TaxID=1661 RepID=UPI003872DA2B
MQAHSASASYREVLGALCTSGFPAQNCYSPQEVRPLLAAYLNEISYTHVFLLADLRTPPTVIEQLIRSLARNSAAEVTFATLAKDVRPLAPTFSPETAVHIMQLLERLFVVENVPAFGPKLGSKARLRTSLKYHLADPALAAVALAKVALGAVALGATEPGLLADPETASFLFESAVVHNLAVYAEKLGRGCRITAIHMVTRSIRSSLFPTAVEPASKLSFEAVGPASKSSLEAARLRRVRPHFWRQVPRSMLAIRSSERSSRQQGSPRISGVGWWLFH